MTTDDSLDSYFQQVQDIILSRQDWITGLLPASTAVNIHGNYTDAWVRDNVYSILAVWGLGLAYNKTGLNPSRGYVLEQSTVKLMRGLLTSMMRQASKVEKFKHTQNPLDALHAKYDTKTGLAVVGDHEWGHLQLDATSIFLLMLAQMTASGLRIVFTIDEVNFVQNLVHYVSRAYRAPDYGIWERGNKINHGIAELNASSMGMAKAALEALAGFNLFGAQGGQAGVIHVVSDDIARSRIALESLLPRESLSKEVDAALLSITGFPAFAVDNAELKMKTEALVVEKLKGRYGCKRFLLDGHQTVIEDSSRLHYNPQELKQFQHIECEWPLFFCYLMLNAQFAGRETQAAEYKHKLQTLLVIHDHSQLLPELYYVPKDAIEAEKASPQSQDRLPNENIPLVWAQSLYLLACLLQDGVLTLKDIDPLARHKKVHQASTCVLQIALIAEDESVKAELNAAGIRAESLAEIAPIQLRDASELAEAYTQVGRNDRIGLTGRPLRQLRTLATSTLYVLAQERLIFSPQCLNQKGFYLAMDNRLLIQRLKVELAYIFKHWDRNGQPIIAMPIKHNMLVSHNKDVLIAFIHELQTGMVNQIPVCLGPLAELALLAGSEKIDYLHDFEFSRSGWHDVERPFAQVLPDDVSAYQSLDVLVLNHWEMCDDAALIGQLQGQANLYLHLEVLSLLVQRHGLDYRLTLAGEEVAVRDLLEEVYQRAGDAHAWYIVRRAAGVLGKYDINLEQAATDILVRQHLLTVGRAYSGKATLKRPTDSWEILQIIQTYNSQSEIIIVQELILYLGMLIKSNPELFADIHTLRVGHILQLILVRYKRDLACSLDHAFNQVLFLSPYELAQKVRETLADYSNTEAALSQVEALQFAGDCKELTHIRFSKAMDADDHGLTSDWYTWREQQGGLGRENDEFYSGVWLLLHHCKGVMVGEKLNSNRRLDSELLLSQMTSGEQAFKLHVSHLLNKIQSSVYRQLTVEALKTMAVIVKATPLYIDDTLIIDVLIGHAVRINWLDVHPEHNPCYHEYVAIAWQAFYQLPPHRVANTMVTALAYLLKQHNNP